MVIGTPLKLGKNLAALRQNKPLIHCITNPVSIKLVADILSGMGASPIMASHPEEAAEITQKSDALLVNLGMLTPEVFNAMKLSVAAANARNIPFTLDPVAHFATRMRRDAVKYLIAQQPAIIRANASEILALSTAHHGKGVDSIAELEQAETAARDLAARQQSIIAMTGETDLVTTPDTAFSIKGGSPLMEKNIGNRMHSQRSLRCLFSCYRTS